MSKKIISHTQWECDGADCADFTVSTELPPTWHHGISLRGADTHLCSVCWEKAKPKPDRCHCGRQHVTSLDPTGKWYVECFVNHFSTTRFDTEQAAVVSWNSLLRARDQVYYASPCPVCGQSDCPCWKSKLNAVADQFWPPKLQSCPKCGDHPVTRGSMGTGVKVVCPKGCHSTLWCTNAEIAAKQWNDLITKLPAPFVGRVTVTWQDGTQGGYDNREDALQAIRAVDRPVNEVWEVNLNNDRFRLFIRRVSKLAREDEA